MFLTTRETVLLTELVNSPTPVSVNRMMNLLKVSRRTVYRELENLETSLASMGATLEKVARGRFSIQADEAAMTEIQAAILGEETQELSTFGAATCDFIDITANKRASLYALFSGNVLY